MPKQNVRLLLIEMSTDGGTTYTNVCGLSSRDITLNGNLVDITSINCADPGGTVWRESIAGIQSMDVTGSGFFESKTQTIAFINAKNDGTYLDLRVTAPGLGTFEGNFAVGTLTLSGGVEGAVAQEIELQSSGEVIFTAAV